MNNIWAPWRVEYITAPKNNGCIFCFDTKDESRLVLTRGSMCFAIMNRFPYSTGHCMVVPVRHVGDITALTEAETVELMAMAQAVIKAVRKAMSPDGFNIGFNLGSAAGAGVADHLHMHIVPRWKGDTNFMPVLGDVHVISEHLEKTRDKIKENLS